MNWLDDFWADLLSEEALRIMSIWITLDADTQASVYEHLQRMANGEGWAEAQRESAQTALAVIADSDDSAT